MQFPLVTVILVCWNHERFVRSSILSVVRQTYPNQQIIVFDNDSTDGSQEIIESLAKDYSFEFIHQPNVGLVKTLNRGLAMAKGKYFCVIAADDLWLLDKTERQVSFMESNPEVDLCCGNTVTIDPDDRLIGLSAANRNSMTVTFRDLMSDGNCVQGPSPMIRIQALIDAGGYDERFSIEDYTLALRFAFQGRLIVHTGLLVAQYRRHGSNWSTRALFPEAHEAASLYKNTPEYVLFVKKQLRGYFRELAGKDKRKALTLLFNEPIEWSWFDVGFGLLKLLTPRYVFSLLNRKKYPPA